MKVKRLLFSIALSTALALVAVPQTAEVKAATTTAAVKAVKKQRIGNTSVYWEITKDGTLVLSGKGDPKIKVKIDWDYELHDYAVKELPWFGYRDSIKSVIIEKGVTPKSMSYWFSGCTSLVNAPAIPKGVEDCDGMFNSCTSLKKAPTIPKGVEDCRSMFIGCTSLKKPPV